MTSSLQMVQMRLDNRATLAFAHSRKLPVAGDDLGYVVHSILREAFQELAPQPFAVTAQRRGAIELLGYGRYDAAALHEQMSRFARPEVAALLAAGLIGAKAMPTDWPAGLRLGFEVRACPVVRQKREGTTHHRETDAFLAAVAKVEPEERVRREAVYREWLAGELGRGDAAHLLTARLTGFRRVRLGRRDRQRGLHHSEKPDAVFRGELAVTSPAAFLDLLRRGVGRHRAFGFGMLLLRPARGKDGWP